MKALPLSKFFDILTEGCEVVVIAPGQGQATKRIRTIRKMSRDVVLSFDGIDDPEKASAFRQAVISVERRLLPPLPDNEYFVADLLGMTVRTTGGLELGTVAEVLTTGSNDVYVVKDGRREYLIPAIKDCIMEIDLQGRAMVISPMQGLLDPD